MTEDQAQKWQAHMDQAYDKWEEGDSYVQFLSSLPTIEQYAVVLGNLNYQVGNGGIAQWTDDGYAIDSTETLLEALATIGTPRCLELRDKVEEFTSQYIDFTKKRSDFGSYWLDHGNRNDDEDNYEDDTPHEACDAFDDFMYDDTFHKELVAEIEAFFTNPSVSL